ncbi:MAG: hypothetical protein NT023_02490 [Armatimonadetes bacterium]|nr:hypothetical protein [Armatimonadota bacterium]
MTTENEILLMSAFDDAPYPQTFGKEEWKSVLDNDPFTDEEDEYPIMTDRIPDFDSPA